MAELIHSVWPAAAKWQILVATFIVYVLLIVIFGAWYYALYIRKATRFFFASEIAAMQARNTVAKTERTLSALTREIDAMDEVRVALDAGALTAFPSKMPSGHTVDVRTLMMHNPFGGSQERLNLTVVDQNGGVLCDVGGPQDDALSSEYLIRWLDEMLDLWRSRQEYRHDYLTSITRDPNKSWGLLDFVYFSAVTQTTVGYGDILPNATAIRMLVMTQILAGYALLVVILNLILVS